MSKKKGFDYSILGPAIVICLLVCLVLIIEKYFGINFSYYGTVPRDITGILGIFLSPFLHGGWEHLFSNLPTLFILMTIILFFYERSSIAILSLIWLFTGSAVWLFGKENTYHIGASGIIYCMMSFIFFSGIFRGERNAMMISLLVLLLNSSLFAGFQPTEGVSWESHLYGAIVGFILAFVFKSVGRKTELQEAKKNIVKTKYFDEGVFDLTKLERIRITQEAMEREREKEEDEI